MRRAIYRRAFDEGRSLLSRAPVIHLATTSEVGEPILRTLNAVVVDDVVAFHGAPAGEKMAGLGRPVVIAAEEMLATIPSYFIDPQRACPATTYYLSAQVHGTLTEVTSAKRKARVLQALMEKYQPEGGYTPLDADNALYRKAVEGILVVEVPFDESTLSCKAKLGQNRKTEELVQVLEGLWKRGAVGDARAIATVLARTPTLPTPAFLRSTTGVHLQCWLDDHERDEAVHLLEGAYWLEELPRTTVRRAVDRATALVGARDDSGRLVGFARAVSDGRVAWLYDVMVHADMRGTGVGTDVVSLLLDHPAVRGCQKIRLGTRDAKAFYRRFGFVDIAGLQKHPPSTDMIRSALESRAAMLQTT